MPFQKLQNFRHSGNLSLVIVIEIQTNVDDFYLEIGLTQLFCATAQK